MNRRPYSRVGSIVSTLAILLGGVGLSGAAPETTGPALPPVDEAQLLADTDARMVTDYLKAARRLNPNLQLVVNDYDNSPGYYDLLRQLLRLRQHDR